MKLSALLVGISLVGLPLILLPEVASAEILSVKGTSANFRERPHEAAKIKFSADKFYPVEVLERKAGWAKVKDFEGDEAWVAERMLQKQPSVVIAVDRANIRESAETASDVVFKAEKGEVFKIEERKGQWLKVVDAKGDGGWIRGDMTWGGEGEKIDEKKTDKAEKVDPKVKGKETESSTKAKEHDEEKKGDVDVKVDEKEVTIKVPTLSEPETLQMLCRAYLDDAPKTTPVKAAPKAEKHTEKAKPAEKKAEKAKPKPAAKPAAKPKK
ncbi:MAG: SH3 domain-containing protein [Myxococcales bacterium]|nr:SH3 domain-containing protein [Myxococcales bacterium]